MDENVQTNPTRKEVRWNEPCSRCGEKCKGKGSNWIDNTRVCPLCRKLLEEDTLELQAITSQFFEHIISTDEMIAILSRKRYQIYIKQKAG